MVLIKVAGFDFYLESVYAALNQSKLLKPVAFIFHKVDW